MLFYFNPTADKRQNISIQSLYLWISKYRMTLIIFLLCIILVILFNIKVALISGLSIYASMVCHNVWNEVANLDFTVQLDEFNLQDVINDLESK